MSALENIQEIMELGLQEAMRRPTPELCISYFLGFVGRILHAERAYVFKKNPDRSDSNIFEWVASGIMPEKENLQNIPEEIGRPWYEQFKTQRIVIVEDMEEIKAAHPVLYETLAAQNIRSLVAAPLFDEQGVPSGFFGLDNPIKELLRYNQKLVRTIAGFIESTLKRADPDNSAL